jgi:uncharacterized membrane protein
MNERQERSALSAPDESSAPISWINIILAIWVIISPFVLGFTGSPRAMWNNIATGCAIAILAIIRTSMRSQPGWSWVNVILGIWLIVSPFALVFITGSAALWNNVILGIIITIVAWSNSARTALTSA